MPRKGRSPTAAQQLAFYVPASEASAIRAVAEARGLTVSRWLREAAQWNLVREGRRQAPAEEEAYIRTVFKDVFAGVNFAAIAAQTSVLLIRQQLVDQLMTVDRLPSPLAEEKATLMMDEALLNATAIFAHPQIQQDYSWHHRDPDAIPGLFRQSAATDEEA